MSLVYFQTIRVNLKIDINRIIKLKIDNIKKNKHLD